MPSKFDLNMKSRSSDKSTDFVAGDGRAETHVGHDDDSVPHDSLVILFQSALVSLQNLLFNEHNRIAGVLMAEFQGKVADTDLDEVVYQETRRIVVAVVQHITYTEWLPVILGQNMVASLGLNHEQCVYKEKVDAGILNSFSTAAFRLVLNSRRGFEDVLLIQLMDGCTSGISSALIG